MRTLLAWLAPPLQCLLPYFFSITWFLNVIQSNEIHPLEGEELPGTLQGHAWGGGLGLPSWALGAVHVDENSKLPTFGLRGSSVESWKENRGREVPSATTPCAPRCLPPIILYFECVLISH